MHWASSEKVILPRGCDLIMEFTSHIVITEFGKKASAQTSLETPCSLNEFQISRNDLRCCLAFSGMGRLINPPARAGGFCPAGAS
ncbi:hypothetical protein V6N12_010017 [Hibiscus sabdariffa]|uniref:Uncharacterized protein n=1 Tax=Hibiscus sabdariffa TaxID=183260 RepID=A0ABR2ECF1_9ROSI